MINTSPHVDNWSQQAGIYDCAAANQQPFPPYWVISVINFIWWMYLRYTAWVNIVMTLYIYYIWLQLSPIDQLMVKYLPCGGSATNLGFCQGRQLKYLSVILFEPGTAALVDLWALKLTSRTHKHECEKHHLRIMWVKNSKRSPLGVWDTSALLFFWLRRWKKKPSHQSMKAWAGC